MAGSQTMKKDKRDPAILFRIDKDSYRALRMLAVKKDTTVGPYIRELILKHLARKEGAQSNG